MTDKSEKTAKTIQTLLWYDQPEIALFQVGLNEFILAVASPNADNDSALFIGASMTLGFLTDYQDGKYDLRYALSHANLRRYWTLSFTGREEQVSAVRLVKSSKLVSAALPDSQFFARDHAPIKIVAKFVPDTTERFEVDGSWELGEFSKLYAQVEDIYYIFNDIRRFTRASTSSATRQAISSAMDRPWKGGGSYVAYYQNLANDNAPEERLQVGGIQYNSPGYVSIKARKLPFDDMIALIQAYASEKPRVKKAYSTLYSFMAQNKLLSREKLKGFVSDETRQSIKRMGSELDAYMPGISFQTFVNMANGDEIIGAKVLLSVFRRMDRLFKFFEQGRVSHEGIRVDPLNDDSLEVEGLNE